MPKDFGDYSLDDPPVCPNCHNQNEIGIYKNGYYCLDCGFDFLSFQNYSQGYPSSTLPEIQSKILAGTVKIIDVKDYTVTHKERAYTDNVTNFNDFKNRKLAKQEATKLVSVVDDTLPDDYEECADCKFDHGYDYAAAMRWHKEHPEVGECLTQDDLVLE